MLPVGDTLVGMVVTRGTILVSGVVVALAFACGDDGDTGVFVADGTLEIPCSAYSVYRCWRDHSDTCRVNEATRLDLDDVCFGDNTWSQNCTEIEGCIEEEWFAETEYGEPVVVDGCANDPPPALRPIADPSAAVLLAAATSCDEVFRQRSERCSSLSVEDCVEQGEGCRVRTDDVIDRELYCDTGEKQQVCEYPSAVSPSTISFRLCPDAKCTGDERQFEGCLDSTACVWTTMEESRCLPTCDPAAPECGESEECVPLLRRGSDSAGETTDVCVL